ncbi:MAG: DUF4981 domain-containing protein [Clostridia bacterium]|nr:DUF4981 domain-containing protein [Clostridia bacterium]
MFDYNLLKDPGYYRENRLDAHSDHIAYASAAELSAGVSSLRVSLNGVWKFFHAKNNSQVIPGFESAEYDCRSWDNIAVPAHIQREGYGVPQYCNTQYPWDAERAMDPGDLPEDFNPVACYVKYFTLPEAWAGKRVFISFQGVESCVAVWLNGQYIGFSSDSFTPHEFDLTDALVPGENKLACRVYRFCAGSWLEDQDFLRFSGIFRDVYLYAAGNAHIRDIKITAVPADDFTSGTVTAGITADAPAGSRVTVLLAEGNTPVRTAEAAAVNGVNTFTLEAPLPHLWSSEDPYLYDLFIILAGPDGQTEYVRERVGFRKIEIKNSVILVNGRRVVFKGVNRHDFCGETGRYVPEEKVRQALITMKRNNINAIRTSHYPNGSALYRLCDEFGLYVIDENNMESHGMWDRHWRDKTQPVFPGNQTEWQPLLLDRVRSVYERDKNHPCVVIWSDGNESLSGSVTLAMSDEFRRLDPTRLVHYEGDCHMEPENRVRNVTDIESAMYVPAKRIREYLKTNREKPYILCEYVHSMGNSNGAMHLYTDLAYEDELYQGGFIWDFIDQSMTETDRHGNDRLLYGGDWGDRPHDGIFCGNGIVFGDGRPTPKLQEIRYNYRNIYASFEGQNVKIINRNMFTPTSDFRCIAELARDGEVIARTDMRTAVPPLSEETYPLPFGAQAAPGEYTVTLSFRLRRDTLWAEAGYEIAWAQHVYSVAGAHPARITRGPLKVSSTICNIGISGDDFSLIISRGMGLVSYKYCGREYLRLPQKPSFWRAPTNNDNGNNMPLRYAQWKLASIYPHNGFTRETGRWNAEQQPVMNADGTVSFSMKYDLPSTPAACCTVTWTVHRCGKVDTRLVYDPVQGLPEPPEFGMMMKLPADLNRVSYYGLGPDENYCDRREGARLGKWSFNVQDNLTPYLLPQESGCRTGVRTARVYGANGHGLEFFLHGGELSVLPWTPHEIENADHADELPVPYQTVVRLLKQQMGVGGDDSWGARTHDEDLLDASGRMEYEFSFRGIV